ncbi:MAG: ATP-binding protein [Thermoguttaceae bacterium]
MSVVSDVPGMSPAQLAADLEERLVAPIQYYRPIMITGCPGYGKTAIAKQVCDRMGMPFWTCRPIQHETVEYTGLPHVNGDGMAHWVPFADLLPVDPAWSGCIFVDELTQLDLAAQKIVASLLDKEGVAGRRIPAGARFILAGNRQQDRAGSSRLLSIIESRCRQVELLFSVQDWQHWAMREGLHPVVISFAAFKGGDFVSFDPAKTLNPLPRTWHNVSNELMCHPNAGASKDDPIILAAVRGWVGSGKAAEFMAFREHFHLLHNVVDQVFTNPDQANIGSGDSSVQHALVGAIAQRVKERNGSMTDQHLGNTVVFGKRFLPRSLQALLVLQCVASGCKRFLQVDACRAWCMENKATIDAWKKGVI